MRESTDKRGDHLLFDCTVGIKKNNSNIDQIGQDFGHDWMRLDENWTKSSFILDGTLKINEFMVAWEKCSVSLKFCPALTQNNLYNKFCTKACVKVYTVIPTAPASAREPLINSPRYSDSEVGE
jgi:hypothetical protein